MFFNPRVVDTQKLSAASSHVVAMLALGAFAVEELVDWVILRAAPD